MELPWAVETMTCTGGMLRCKLDRRSNAQGETVEITELSLHVASGEWPLMPNYSLLKRVDE